MCVVLYAMPGGVCVCFMFSGSGLCCRWNKVKPTASVDSFQLAGAQYCGLEWEGKSAAFFFTGCV